MCRLRLIFLLSVATAGTPALAASQSFPEQAPSEAPFDLPPFWVEVAPAASDDLVRRSAILTRDDRTARSNHTLKDSFGDAPGVLLQESFGGFEPPRISIRGSGLQSAPSSRGVAFLVDGFPLNLADGSFNSALIEPRFFERLELLRGHAPAVATSAVLGGVFNLHTGGLPGFRLRTTAGSFGAFDASASARRELEFRSFDTAAAFVRLRGFRPRMEQQRTTLRASVHHPFPHGCDSSVSIYHARATYDVPGPLDLATAFRSPRSISSDVVRDQPHRESETTQLAARLEQHNETLSLEIGLAWLRTTDRFQQLRANGLTASRSDDVTLRSSLVRRFDSDVGNHLVEATATLSRGWRDLKRFRNDSGSSGPLFGHARLFATTASLDLAGTMRLRERTSFALGLSALHAERDVSDRFSPAAPAPVSRRIRSFTLQPRAELNALLGNGFTAHVGVTRRIEPPTFDDLLFVTGTYPNLQHHSQSLAAQRATFFELGTTASRGSFTWDVTAYTSAWRDEILRLADASGQPRGSVNAGPTQHAGVETSLRWRVLNASHQLHAAATATWNRFVFDDDPLYARNRLAGAPPHHGSFALLYEHPRGFFATPSIEWTGGQTPVDHANRLTYGGHTLVHLRLGWRKPHRWTVFIEFKNLLNRPHIASTAGVLDLARQPATTAIFLPARPRTFSLGFEWTP